jgi:hypothetical protein
VIAVSDLFRRCYRAISPDPRAETAMTIRHAAGGTWSIAAGVLTIQATGVAATTLPLASHTITSLAAAVTAAGWTAPQISAAWQARNALCLVEAAGTAAAGVAVPLEATNSIAFALFGAYAAALRDAQAVAQDAPRQIDLATAEGIWLDQLGTLYGVPRKPGELDAPYATRVVAEVLRPRANNLAMAAIVAEATGRAARIVDVTLYDNPVPVYDGAALHNGAFTHNASARRIYGAFDCDLDYDPAVDGSPAQVDARVRAIIAPLKAGGTVLRRVNLRSDTLIGYGAIQPPLSLTRAQASGAIATADI